MSELVKRRFSLADGIEVLTDDDHPTVVFIAVKQGDTWIAMPIPVDDVAGFVEAIADAVNAISSDVSRNN